MKNFIKVLFGLAIFLVIGYMAGPKPEAPKFETKTFVLPDALPDLEKQINEEELLVKGLRPDNQARIVWADSSQKVKTKIALLYIHGFSASQGEGDPVHRDLAKKFGANLYLARLADHGIDLGDSTMNHVTSDDYVNSAEKALAIAKKIGDEVIVVGTSFGGALTLYLASKHPEIKSIVLYSPCIKVYDKNAELLDNHWGRQLAKLVTGSETRVINSPSAKYSQYWSTRYDINGVIALQNFLTHAMNKETFEKVKCPVFLAYWYKNEEEQDKVVSVPAMLKMYDELGVPLKLKKKEAFPNAGHHVLASYVVSKDYQGVERETEAFLKEVLSYK
ncbi:Esterase/lipase [Pseudarcicella hirudinis]|uniref:Esterase/lipase n=1 Tax=Pseudarcicella hirudinis TaxID=1079859 RepID=A0A1I5QXG9_9BACT|nr:alpha/beta hydrolase [Pseudarcicella hirudinis]SFP50787.1 Esterase/lipase [Pseudarcicella hirudinis]